MDENTIVNVIGYRDDKLFIEHDGRQYILKCDPEKVKDLVPNLNDISKEDVSYDE